MNESGSRLEVHWINPSSGDLVIQSEPHIFHGASFTVNSYVGHKFQARELKSDKTGLCGGAIAGGVGNGEGDKHCYIGYFTVNENDDQSER